MDLKALLNNGVEIIFILCGLVSIGTAIRALKNEKSKYGTFAFWCVFGIIFMFGKQIPANIVGGLLVFLGILTATKQVQMGKFTEISADERKAHAERLGNSIFIPALTIGVVAMILSQIKLTGADGKAFSIPSAVAIGSASIIAYLVGALITKPKVKETYEGSTKLLMTVGASSLLPQLLGALGTVFTKAGVGDVISGAIKGVVPEGNIFIGVVVYCIGMVLFTMIMGNAFAAFSVITVGIGVPFVISQGGNPAVAGALAMTCGYCGTLMTPMAANFNIVPGSVLETKDKYEVIKAQLPVALTLIVVHIVLMLTLAF